MDCTIRFALAASIALAIALAVAAPSAAQTIRVNCGGPEITSGSRVFVADRPYTPGGGFGYFGGSAIGGPSLQPDFVAGTTAPIVYDDARAGLFAYRFEVTPGRHRVRLHFAEIEKHGPGQRFFRVVAENVPRYDLDLFASVEKDRALDFQFAVQVNDGLLDLAFLPFTGDAILNAISVSPYPSETTPPAVPQQLSVRGSYARTIVSWKESPDPDVAGYRVYRASAPGGPFTLVSGTTLDLQTRFFDDDVQVGQARFYRVAAVDANGNESAPTAARAGIPRNEASATLPVMKITLDPEDLAELQAEPFSDEDAEGSFEHRGVVHEGVDLRFRGQTSRFWNKKSWKIDFPNAAPFLGVDELNLNAKPMDTTLLKECIATGLLEGLAVRVPRCTPIHLQVNGEFRGVFSSIEEMESPFLDRVGLDPQGSLYEATGVAPVGMQKHASLAEYMEAFEKESNEGQPFDDLIAFLELVNDTPAPAFPAALAGAFAVDPYLDYAAGVSVVADVDQVHNNFTLFHDLERGVWEMLTRDHDNTFFYASAPIDYGTQASPGIGSGTYNRLLDRVLATPIFRQQYADKLRELLAGDYSEEQLSPRLLALFGEVAFDGRVDVFKLGGEENTAFNQGPSTLATFAAQRRAFLQNALGSFGANTPARVVINEVLASNQEGATDEAGEHEDWAELVNRSAQPVDLSGYGLTDDLEEPHKWAFPAGVVIAPGQRVLVWADEDLGQGSLHADFKISKGGEVLGLFTPAGALVDYVSLRAQRDDVSYGRRFDGSAFWVEQGEATPGAPNTGRGNPPPNFWSVRTETPLPQPGAPNPLTVMIEDDGGVASATLWIDTGTGFAAAPLRDDGLSGDESAGDALFGATLPGVPNGTTVRYYLEATDDQGRSATDPDEGADEPYSYALDAPSVPVFVNEIMADNDATIADEAGDFEDYIELYNAGPTAVDLSGMFLSDTLTSPQKWQIPAGTTIAAGGHLLFWADSEPEEGPLHADFGLSAGGESVGLFQTVANGNGLIDGFDFPSPGTDVAFGRTPDGGATLGILPSPSPGGAN
jgi:hypothetical protein